MTIHRALSELKLIDAKIEKHISQLVPTGIYQKGKLIKGYQTEEDFAKSAQSNYQSVIDLIKRKTAIKSAIVAANGVTKVTVAGKDMTVADAINFKAVVAHKKKLINRLESMHTSTLAELNKNNTIVENNVQKLLEMTFGKENVKADAKDMDAVRKPYMEQNEFHLFDPLKVVHIGEAIEKEVTEFEAEVDATLSEINAVTYITITV